MRYYNYLFASLASALLVIYITLWFVSPAPVERYAIPQLPMKAQVRQGDMPL